MQRAKNCVTIRAMTIHVLPDELAAKIAAGEVIERPSSVVKELIENSIDAGATEIKVEVRGGGQRLVRVMDDGGGIPADQVATAFARHATSKIESADDLFRIHTLGFRGEALPSIAAVARVTLISRARSDASGSEIRLDGGKIIAQGAQGAPVGTVITVEDLFRHVPARLKFLKSEATEAGHIADLINAYALAYPQLRFALVNEGRAVFQSPGTGSQFDVMVKVFGIETAKQMLQVSSYGFQVSGSDDAMNLPPDSSGSDGKPETLNLQPQVSGYVSPPALNRATRKHMLFFVNHRWIQDRTLTHAVVEAYHTALMVQRHPIVVLDVIVPPDVVDVNVHPTKSEVRFRDASAVFSAVQRSVRAALTAHAPIPAISPAPAFPRGDSAWQQAINLQRPTTDDRRPMTDDARSTTEDNATNGLSNLPPTKLPMLRVLGQIMSTYIIAEGPDGLYLIDQHAAHERVLYEQLSAERAGAAVATQELLDPAPVQLTLAQYGILQAQRDVLATVGFRVEPFGSQTFLLRAIPAVMKKADPRAAFVAILDEMEQGETPLEKGAEARLISSVCKSIAVKGGQVLSLEEMRELVRRLEQTSAPRTCPHGRPTVIALNVSQLEREFGRK